MKILNIFLLGLVAGSSIVFTSCDKEDDYSSSNNVQTPTTKISKPTLARDLTTTTTMDVSIRCRFDNGGDTWNNMSCTVHWRKYSSKPSTTPSASDMTNHESMRQYASTSKSTTFDKSHSGLSGGTYIYYYFECRNSKYTTKTNVTYCIVKR